MYQPVDGEYAPASSSSWRSFERVLGVANQAADQQGTSTTVGMLMASFVHHHLRLAGLQTISGSSLLPEIVNLAAIGYGIRTLSTTWITPLDWYTSPIVT